MVVFPTIYEKVFIMFNFNKLSISDIGEHFADSNLSSKALARELDTRIPEYRSKQSKETKKSLMQGFSKRWFREFPNALEHYYKEGKNGYVKISKQEFDNVAKGTIRHCATDEDLIRYVEVGQSWSGLKQSDPFMYDLLKSDREALRKFRNSQHAKLMTALNELYKEPTERKTYSMWELGKKAVDSQIDRLRKQCDANDEFALAMKVEWYAWLQDGKKLLEKYKKVTK